MLGGIRDVHLEDPLKPIVVVYKWHWWFDLYFLQTIFIFYVCNVWASAESDLGSRWLKSWITLLFLTTDGSNTFRVYTNYWPHCLIFPKIPCLQYRTRTFSKVSRLYIFFPGLLNNDPNNQNTQNAKPFFCREHVTRFASELSIPAKGGATHFQIHVDYHLGEYVVERYSVLNIQSRNGFMNFVVDKTPSPGEVV